MKYKIKKISKIYSKGIGLVNEDDYLIKDNFFVVFDGASSLDSFSTDKGKTGGRIAVDITRETFYLSDSSSSVDAAIVSNNKIAQEMNRHGINLSAKEKLWSTAIAAVKVDDNKLDYFGIGDCFALTIFRKGTFDFILPYEDHDEETLTIMKEKKIKPAERRKIVDQIVKVRRMANRTYGFLNGEKAAENFFKVGSCVLDNVKSIILSTDGLMMPNENPSREPNWNKFVSLYKEGGLNVVYDYILKLEKEDPDCIKYPRFKQHDDKTAISIDFE